MPTKKKTPKTKAPTKKYSGGTAEARLLRSAFVVVNPYASHFYSVCFPSMPTRVRVKGGSMEPGMVCLWVADEGGRNRLSPVYDEVGVSEITHALNELAVYEKYRKSRPDLRPEGVMWLDRAPKLVRDAASRFVKALLSDEAGATEPYYRTWLLDRGGYNR